jgi:hypothetical protein
MYGMNVNIPSKSIAENKSMELEHTNEPSPCFIINDPSLDSRFSSLAIVDGTLASYRIYAGTPITTSRGITIGSSFMFDDRPCGGLSTT